MRNMKNKVKKVVEKESEDDDLSMSDASDIDEMVEDDDGPEEDASEEDDDEPSDELEEGENGTKGSDSEDGGWMDEDDHMKSLKNLQKTDPEFYKYLEENDKKLLMFQESDEDDEEDDGSMTHEPPEKLEVDSEESDFDADEKDGIASVRSSSSVTLAQLNEWRHELASEPSPKSITRATDLFHAALDRVTGEEGSVYKIDGSAVFNGVIEMCVMHMHSSLIEFLKLTPSTAKNPEKSKKWIKVRGAMNTYLTDLFKLMNGVASDHILSVMLKHLHSMCSFLACFPKISKSGLKILTKLWSSGEETVRVLAFLCIIRLTTLHKNALLNSALKMMYIAYIRGSKFVSMNTLPQINFMKLSLVDMYKLDPALSYQHAFLYIRQLAIHLRNAVTTHKKQAFQTVYNWQYIHSLRLWVDLLCVAHETELQQLLYPLVQIILGCIKLIPTAQYIPLRFHCLQMLIKLAQQTNTFIPTLPLILDSFTIVDLNKHHKKASMKPFDFTFVLRVSKMAMAENGFTDAVVDYVYQLLMESTAGVSHSIAFPDMVVPAIIQLKGFLKNSKIPKYNSKIKQLLTKLTENYTFVDNARNQLSLNLNETAKIAAFEMDLKAKGPPLAKYWEQVKKSQTARMAKQATNNDKIANERMNLPKLKKRHAAKAEEDKKAVSEGPVDLFPSDDSDFEFPDVEDDSPPKKSKKTEKRGKTKGKKLRKPAEKPTEANDSDVPDQDDIVEELDVDAL